MTATVKQALRKVTAVKAQTAAATETKPRGLVSLFPGLASIEKKLDRGSLFPGFIALVQDDAKNYVRAMRANARQLRREARASRRSGRPDASSVFNFGFLRVKRVKKTETFRVTFAVSA